MASISLRDAALRSAFDGCRDVHADSVGQARQGSRRAAVYGALFDSDQRLKVARVTASASAEAAKARRSGRPSGSSLRLSEAPGLAVP